MDLVPISNVRVNAVESYLLMQRFPVFRAVFSAFGEYLDTVIALGKIDMYLAVFAIILLFAAHPTIT